MKLSLTSEDLLNKTFTGAIRGYDAFEVDTFLDKVLKDYRIIEENYLMSKEQIDALNKKIADLQDDKEKLQISNESMKQKLGNIGDNKNAGVDNITLLKRIDRLERHLWKLGENPNKI